MSATNENHEPVQNDDRHDRLIDAALTEVVGGHAPPDLSSRIMAAVDAAHLAKPQPVAVGNYARQFKWISVAVAASLLLGMGFTISGYQSNHERKTPVAVSSNRIISEKDKQTKITEYVDEFNRLQGEQRYAEMETVARRLNELAPDDPVAQQVWLNAKFIRRELENKQRGDSKEDSSWVQLYTSEKSAVSPIAQDGREVAHDKQHWDSFVKNREGQPEAATAAAKHPGVVAQGPNRPADFDSLSDLVTEAAPAPAVSPNGSPVAAEARVKGRGGEYAVPLMAGSSAPQPASQSQLAVAPPVAGARPGLRQNSFGVEEVAAQPAPAAPQLPSAYYLTDDVEYLAKSNAKTPSLTAAHPQDGREQFYGALSTNTTRWDVNQPAETADLLSPLPLQKTPEGRGPGLSGDKYVPIVENPFIKAEGEAAVSTFSIDVDTASYSNVRQFLMESNQLPPPDAVRIEELVNYFDYDYAGRSAPGSAGGSSDEAPFAAHVEVASCPWNGEHRLARIAVKGREMDAAKRPQSNLVFLVDVSGSMNEPAKLPLVVYGLERLTKELGENDHIAIVVYASSEGLVLPSTSGTKQKEILDALGKLQAGGSTAGGAGIQLAYQIAEDNFIKGGTNRVILCTDGDFNVGVTSTAELQRLVEKKAKDTGVFLSVLGFGRGNLNDAMMEAIADHGNGNYHYVDNKTEARRVLVEQMTGTLVTIAKDVKIQVEFNPSKVAGYRLIGYENRMLRTEDFNDDKKDAGEIGVGHTVTALYEIVPAGKKVDVAPVDDLKYQKKSARNSDRADEKKSNDESDELLTLKMRYKAPDGDTSKKLEWPVKDDAQAFAEASDDYQFAAAVAGFGLLLRDSQYKGNLTLAAVLELAQSGLGHDEKGYRSEFLDIVRKAQQLKGE